MNNHHPIEVSTDLNDLMRFEYMVQSGKILPDRPIYSILVGRHAAKMRGRGLDFEEVRTYVPGDDIRNIDWRVTARTNETYSKVFNEEKERPVFIILDQSSHMFFGSRRYVKSVSAAHVAALSAFYTIKRGDRFGGLIFNEEGHDYVAPKRSKTLVEHFLQLTVDRNKALLSRDHTGNNLSLLNKMLGQARTLTSHDYVIGIITNALLLDKESKQYIRSMALHNNVILIHIEDPMDKELPEGELVLTDGNHQLLWNNQEDKAGTKYTIDYNHKLAALKEEFRTYNIPVSIINTENPVELQIKERMEEQVKK